MSNVEPIVEELIPCPDPWDVARKLAHLPHLLFLDSSDRERGRYSYVMAEPHQWFTEVSQQDGLMQLEVRHREFGTAIGDVAFHYREMRKLKTRDDVPPFQTGVAGLFGYDLNSQLEEIRGVAWRLMNDFPVPLLGAGEYRWVVAFDHHQDRAWLLRKPGSGLKLPEFQKLLNRKPDTFSRDAKRSAVGNWVPPVRSEIGHAHSLRIASRLNGIDSNFTREQYIASVQRVIDYIHAGDCFQVNLSQRLLTPLTEHPLDLYGRLRQVSPSPYGCYFDLGEFQILSASPEQFLKVTHTGEVITRPIKGTRPRGKTIQEDAEQLRDLMTNPKDRAENVMIVDLLRNDIGKVCEYGSVRVPKVCEVESYNYVHHLVSEVRGQLRKDKTPFDLLKACFPGGSVTGAPKVRAMEIIAELEPTARGPYCGSIGFIGFDGAMDSNILIRTFTAGKGWLQFPVGGGIVADSIPEREYEETLHKAAGLLKALNK